MTKLNRLLWYGGDWHDSIDGELIDIKNPATGHAIGRTAVAGPRDIEKGVLAAENVKREWAAMHPDERARIIHSAADKIAENIDEIARVLTLEQGKPLCDSQKEILFGVRVLHYYAEEGKRIFGSLRPGSSQSRNCSCFRNGIRVYGPARHGSSLKEYKEGISRARRPFSIHCFG